MLHGAVIGGIGGCSSGEHDAPAPLAPAPSSNVRFPLRLEAGKRYLVDAAGLPFLLHGDTAWSIVGQLTDAQIEQYLDDRRARGFTAVLFNAPERFYTNQKPNYNNVDGIAPFASMGNFASPDARYWARVDRVVQGAKSRGMVCIINPAYLGYEVDGWLAEISVASDESLQAYGAWLARRYTHGNIIWCLGGDHDQPASLLRKQWNIVDGMRTVRTSDLVTGHPMSDFANADDAYTYWNGLPGFVLNAIYGYETNGKYTHALCEQAYARGMPFLGFEFKYENSEGATLAMLRRQSYGALLSGACGQIYGNNPIWHFGSRAWTEPHPGTWQSNLASPGALHQTYLKALFSTIAWWKLEPSVDGSLVTSSFGTGSARLFAARANDGDFAVVYVPQAQTVSLQLASLRSHAVRVRLYDPTSGQYVELAASAPSNVPLEIATAGERLIVLEAAA